jgi:hypothetical protein
MRKLKVVASLEVETGARRQIWGPKRVQGRKGEPDSKGTQLGGTPYLLGVFLDYFWGVSCDMYRDPRNQDCYLQPTTLPVTWPGPDAVTIPLYPLKPTFLLLSLIGLWKRDGLREKVKCRFCTIDCQYAARWVNIGKELTRSSLTTLSRFSAC